MPVNRTNELGIGDDTSGSGAAGIQAGLSDISRGVQQTGGDIANSLGRVRENAPAIGAGLQRGDLPSAAGAFGQTVLGAAGAALAPLNTAGHIAGAYARDQGASEGLANAADVGTALLTTGGAEALAAAPRLLTSKVGQAFLAQGAPGAAAQITSDGLGALKAIPGAAAAIAQAAPEIGRLLWQPVVTPDVAAGIVAGARGGVQGLESVDAPLMDEMVRLYQVEQLPKRQIAETLRMPYQAVSRVIDDAGVTRSASMETALARTRRYGQMDPPDSVHPGDARVPYARPDGEVQVLDSSYEALHAHQLDSDPDIAWWSGNLDIQIPYVREDGGIGTYHPDFLTISARDGSAELQEIKPDAAIGAAAKSHTAGGANLNVMRKAEAGRVWAANLGMGYRIFTEDQIGRDALRGADPAQMPGLANLDAASLALVRRRMRDVSAQENPAVARLVADFNAATPFPRVANAAKYGIVQGGGDSGPLGARGTQLGGAGTQLGGSSRDVPPPPGISQDVWQTQVAALDAALSKARSSYEAGGGPAAPQAVAESEQAYRAAIDAQLRDSGRGRLIGQPGTYGNGLAAGGGTPETSFRALLAGAAGHPAVRGSDLLAGRVGAVAGGLTGATSGPSDQPPGERAGRTVEGALFGGLTGIAGAQAIRGVAPVLAQLDRLSELGVLPAAEEEAGRLRASIEQRAAAWDQAQQQLTKLQSEIALRSGAGGEVGAIERPAWAAASGGRRAMTDAELADLAGRSGVNPYEPQWDQRLDPATIRAYQQEVVSSKTGTSQVGQTPGQARAHLAELRRQATALQGQLRVFEREMNQDLSRVSVLEQRAGRAPFPFESTESTPAAAPGEGAAGAGGAPGAPAAPLWAQNQDLQAQLAAARANAARANAARANAARATPPRLLGSRGQPLAPPTSATGATRSPDVGPPLTGGTQPRLLGPDGRPLPLPPATTPIEAPPLQQEMQAARTYRQAARGAVQADAQAAQDAAAAAPPPPRPTVLGVPRPTLAEAASAVQSGPLAAPSSLLQNFLSGAFRTVQRVAQESVTDPAGTPADLDAMRRAIPDALAQAVREFRAGPSAALSRGLAPAAGGLEHSQGVLPTLLTAGVRGNIATDRFMANLNAAGATARAARHGLSETDAAELAGQAADFATYKGQPSPLATALSAGRKWVDDPKAPLGYRAVGTVLMALAPYVRTPERVLGASIGLATDPFTRPVALYLALKQGNGPAVREGIGRLVLGTTLDTWLAMEAAHGDLHGDPPRDQAQRRRMEADGVQWNTLAGVPLRNYGTFGDAASAIATTVAAAQDALQAGKDPATAARAGVDSALAWTLSKSYVRDLARFAQDWSEGKGTQAVVREAAGLATRPIAPLTNLAGAADPYERKTSSAGITGEVLSTLPGGRYALPVQQNELGQPLLRGGSGLSRAFGQSVPGGPQGAQIRRYVGSSGAAQDAAIAAALSAVHRYQANPQANPRPTSDQRSLYAVFGSRGENPAYTRARQGELERQRRAALVAGGTGR